jgi:Na+/proline symporter
MSKVVAGFLIPLVSVWMYAYKGGLKGTLVSSYVQAATIFLVIIITVFTSYTGGGEQGLWGNPGNVLAGLEKATVHAFFDATASESAYLGTNGSSANPTFFSGLGGIMGNDGHCFDSNKKNTKKSCGFVPRAFDDPCCTTIDYDDVPGGSYCRSNDKDCVSAAGNKHFESTQCNFAAGERCVTSFATLGSTSGAIFGITNIVGNFGAVFMDQSYWQSAFAAKPRAAVPGFMVGGLTWWAVPFCMATCTGLVARAMTTHTDINGKIGAYYIDAGASGAGLTPPRVLVQNLGSFGAFLLLLQLFMAIVSTAAAEILAVASILTYDVYWTYINPELKQRRELLQLIFYTTVQNFVTDKDKNTEIVDLVASPERAVEMRLKLNEKTVEIAGSHKLINALMNARFFDQSDLRELELPDSADGEISIGELWPLINKAMAPTCVEGRVLLRTSRFFSLLQALFMGFLTVFLLTMGLSLGHVYMSMGCLVGSAVGPCTFMILVQTTNARGVSWGALGGLALSMLGWIVSAQVEFGEVKYETLMSDWPWVVSNLCALIGGALIVAIATILRPDKEFRWDMINDAIPLVDDALPKRDPVHDTDEMLQRDLLFAKVVSLSLSVIFVGLWPVPQHLFGGIMSDGEFAFWVAMVFIAALSAGLFIMIFPIFEVYVDLVENRFKNTETRKIMFMTDDEITADDKRIEEEASQKQEMYDRMAKRKDELGTSGK